MKSQLKPDYETAEAIRLTDEAKRIEDDFGYEEDWFPYDQRRVLQQADITPYGIHWTWTQVIATIGEYDLSLEIEYKPEISVYKLQLLWYRDGICQPIVRYENSGRHRDIIGPHLNWGDGHGRPVRQDEIPGDDLGKAVGCFCRLEDVKIVLNGNLMFIPAEN